ncbi:MAG: FecR domain-containing protein [Bacteroidota bacterium]
MTDRRLDFLFQRLLRREVTAAEKKELMDLVADEDNEQQVNALLEDSWNRHAFSGVRFTAEESDQLLKDINTAKQPSVRNPAIISWYRYAIAASLLFFLSIGGYFLIHKDPDTQTSRQLVTHVKKEFNKAMLTLANGKKIDLSDAKSGELVKESGLKIYKDRQGKLTYVVQGGDSDATQPISYNTMETPKGGQWHLILADGTHVWLNAASSIRYPTRFTGAERNVELSGEAYFEVAKKKDMPFIVKTSQTAIKVLGTHFNVNAYESADTKTTLLEGSIQASNSSSTILLKPGQQAIARSNASEIQIKNVNTDESVAWKNGYFVFHNDNILNIMNQLSRWYDIDVRYQGDVTQKRFDGTYSNSKDLPELLNALEQTGIIHFKMEGRRVTVMP